MYGKNIYGLEQYARDRMEDQIPEEYYADLLPYVPPFFEDIREMQGIYRPEGYEVGYLWHCLSDLLAQGFVTTATWGLLRWEREYEIVSNLSLSLEQRREIIMAKMRGQGTTTVPMIRETAAAFSGGEVDVVEDRPGEHFIVRFVGMKGIPRNMQAFIDMLEEIKPAHLAYHFEYTYTVWGNLRAMRWDDLKTHTYDEVRIMEGV